MKQLVLVCLTATLVCGGVASAESTAADLVAAIQDLDVTRVNSLLDEHPELASARGPADVPVLLFAVFSKPKGTPFVRPEDNELVAAVLAREPELGIWEAAVLGRTARLRELIEEHPALHEAALGGDREIVDLLLDFGADPGAKTNACESVSDSARRAGHEELATYLEERESRDTGPR